MKSRQPLDTAQAGGKEGANLSEKSSNKRIWCAKNIKSDVCIASDFSFVRIFGLTKIREELFRFKGGFFSGKIIVYIRIRNRRPSR